MTGPEVTAAMKAEDVDAALVEKASDALSVLRHGIPGEYSDHTRNEVRVALAAVLPEIQAQAQQGLIADLLTRHLWPVRHDLNEYPIEAVPKSVLLEHRNRLARLAATTEGPTT